MKDVNDMLIQYWGQGFRKNELTEAEICEMIKFDWDYSASLADSKRYKMQFLKKTEEKYDKMGLDEEVKKWIKEQERLKTMYPAIHTENK